MISIVPQKQRFEERSEFRFKLPFIFLCHGQSQERITFFCKQLLNFIPHMCKLIGSRLIFKLNLTHRSLGDRVWSPGCADGTFWSICSLYKTHTFFVIISLGSKDSFSLICVLPMYVARKKYFSLKINLGKLLVIMPKSRIHENEGLLRYYCYLSRTLKNIHTFDLVVVLLKMLLRQ